MTNDMTREIPLFPLRAVLFPGMVLPLHIFEERYKQMINLCLQERQPFGVVLIKEGGEVGERPLPYDVGTMATIKSANVLEDDKLDIVAVGLNRFRIERLVTTQAYLSAEVSEFPIQEGSHEAAAALARRVRPRFLEYVNLLDKAANLKLKMNEVPEEPETVAALVAIAMQIELRDKQRIIEMEKVEDMLKAEIGFLAREHMILNFVMETKDEADDFTFGPTGQFHPN